MKVDIYGQHILDEGDLYNIYMENPNRIVKNCLVESNIVFDQNLELNNIPHLIQYIDPEISVSDFDQILQNEWLMPDEYKNLDIEEYLLSLTKTDTERQRVGQELLLYKERNLVALLQYLKFLVDTMRKYNIVWGVGRGSSVSSYILFLLGIHKIDSIYYELDINEFLK
jgi:DNA polymerase III alpha subunit